MNFLTSIDELKTVPGEPGPSSPGSLGDLKRELATGRSDIARLHRTGAPGRGISDALRSLYDYCICRAYREAVERMPSSDRPAILQELAVVAVGGYGRGDLAPFSDIDLLFLIDPRESPPVRRIVTELVRDLWDVGLTLSQSVRTPANCVSMARQDLPARTAMSEARLLAGSAPLFADMQRRIHKFLASSSPHGFLESVLVERAREHVDYIANTVCLLEPNVKKSPGGLRDLHLLRWMGAARYGTPDPESLHLGGLLTDEEASTIASASEFLYRIRHELHFHAGAAQDVLTREEQARLAEWLDFHDEGPLLAVERFMQHYYGRTADLRDAVLAFIERARRPSVARRALDRLSARRIEEFILSQGRLCIDPGSRERVLDNCHRVLRCFDLARERGVPVARSDFEAIRAAVPQYAITPDLRRDFLEMLGRPVRLGQLLRNLHRVGLLGRLVPAFEHARCLIQFNLAHKYTIDEHTILAVERAAARLCDRSPLGQVYREIRHKNILHLALLCHDLGKGLGEDHCEEGRRIALETADLFGLHGHIRDLFVYLVYQHLLMAHTAFRRDVSDPATLVQFARAVGTPEALRMLYVLTAADTEAVSPGNWTAWKESLLTELFVRAIEQLSGEAPVSEGGDLARQLRRDLRDALHIHFPLKWLEAQLELMPISHLQRTDPLRVRAHLRLLRTLPPGDVRVDSEYLPGTSATRFTIVTRDDLIPGIFSKIAGVLAAAQFEILTAQIITRPDGFLIDTFEGVDTDFTGEPPAARRKEIAELIRSVLLGRQTVESLLNNRITFAGKPTTGRTTPPRVEIDNHSSDRFTIVEVFADDRQGLLYDITRTLFDLGLSVHSARISTHVDQVVDVFYVTTQAGRKTDDEATQDVIRARLLTALREPSPSSTF